MRTAWELPFLKILVVTIEKRSSVYVYFSI